MKKKITISLDETILDKIDASVKKAEGKNRSAVIENVLRERYGKLSDVSMIMFTHDYKWDNRAYPFDIPKGLLKVRGQSVVTRQLEAFIQGGIQDFVILIPENTKALFQQECEKYFPGRAFDFLEIDSATLTGDALRKGMNHKKLHDTIMIANGDIFYGDLDITEYYNYHQEQKSDFSFCLKFVMNPEQLGNVAINGNKVLEFIDRPKAKATHLTNSGLYITSKKFLESHEYGVYLEYDFFPTLPNIANAIAFVYGGEWEHIQNDSAFERVNGELM